MLPILGTNKAFIEITNLVHGGSGWELGTCLWSPERDSGGAKAWQLMEQAMPGDIIFHLVKIGGEYHWYGISKTSSPVLSGLPEPPQADKWSNMAPYQRINVEFFQILDSPYPINSFFQTYEQILRSIYVNEKSFYVEYGDNLSLRVAQRYFANCPLGVYNLFNDCSIVLNFNPLFRDFDFVPTENEPQNPDYSSPGRVKTTISRIIRDTPLSRQVKSRNNWKCQVCGLSILLPNGSRYSEGHHLKPLGGVAQGPDTSDNIIVLCPNHHTEFDYGSIAINPITSLINHIELTNPFNNMPLNYHRNDLNQEFIKYHYIERYNKI